MNNNWTVCFFFRLSNEFCTSISHCLMVSCQKDEFNTTGQDNRGRILEAL